MHAGNCSTNLLIMCELTSAGSTQSQWGWLGIIVSSSVGFRNLAPMQISFPAYTHMWQNDHVSCMCDLEDFFNKIFNCNEKLLFSILSVLRACLARFCIFPRYFMPLDRIAFPSSTDLGRRSGRIANKLFITIPPARVFNSYHLTSLAIFIGEFQNIQLLLTKF
jgi:hypothetical protein